MFACSKNIVSQAASPIVLISYAISEEKLFRALPGRLFWDHDQHDLSYLPERRVGVGRACRPLPRLGARPRRRQIGRAHLSTPVTNAHIVWRLLLETQKTMS